MGLLESIKNIMTIPEDDDFEEEVQTSETASLEEQKKKESASVARRSEGQPRIIGGGRNKTVSFQQTQMQVVLVKPDRFEDVTSIADHLNEKKTVVLNLEIASRDISRRIIDFLSGVAYANGGNIRKVAANTYIIVPNDVDVMGELMLEELDEGKFYY